MIFLVGGVTGKRAMSVRDPREGIDEIWPGAGVIDSQRLSAERTKNRLSWIVGMPPYRSTTIRSWNTTTKLMDLLDAGASGER